MNYCDYDVVIIGGSIAARYAALTATQNRATVALVEPKVNYGFHHHVLSQLANLAHCVNDAAEFGIHTLEKSQISVEWQRAMLYAQGVAANIQEQYSPAILAALGVDVIVGDGHFESSHNLTFAVNERLLKARTYLLASGSISAIPEIEGLQKSGFLTLDNIWQSLNSTPPNSTLPKHWVIIGGVPQSIELAQTLARLNCNVTLVVKHPHILPQIEPEIAQLLQAQLEVEGVRVFTQTRVTQVKRIDDKKWLQVGDRAIETDEILVAEAQQPNIESLNLPAVGVKWHEHRLVVNEKLQTTNRRIFACGDVIGGYDCPNVANYEAKIALKNALFFPFHKVDYRHIPWGIFTQPCLAQVGLTEAQAKRRYSDVVVLRQYFKTLAAAQLQDETTGICKLVVRDDGEILGGSVFGAEAGELINIIAMAIAQKIKIQAIANLSFIYPSFSEILQQTALISRQQKLGSNIALQEFLDDFFLFRRSWKL